ncbi:MAG: aminotransferase class V-fold PLP-dependent enzyme [Sedimentisphaerales bacterium]|nr:aminotransferase class V-fold PLP-dependent enzyme [Sedimentisphaerales bacterium]
MIYLNNAASSFPKPKGVIEAADTNLKTPPFHSGRVGFELQSEDTIELCRQNLARLFNVDNPQSIVFTSGATESLNLAIKGARLEGGHVITTAIEHNSILRPLTTLKEVGLIELTIVDCDSNGYVNPQSIADQIRDETKAIIVNHCSNVTGTALDLKAISDIARAAGVLFIVDASQSAGVIPIDLSSCAIDLLAFAGHKSLYGIPGIGGLYITEKMQLELEPLKVGGTGIRSDLLTQPKEMPLYYEAGTLNTTAIAALNAGVEYVLSTGVENIYNARKNLCGRILTQFAQMQQIVVYGNKNPNESTGLLSFNIKDMPPADTGYILENSFDIIIRSGLHCAPLIHKALGSYPQGSIRVSPSVFNTDQEIECFIDAIEQLCTAGAVL